MDVLYLIMAWQILREVKHILQELSKMKFELKFNS